MPVQPGLYIGVLVGGVVVQDQVYGKAFGTCTCRRGAVCDHDSFSNIERNH
jgi:hypothetical protein